MPAKDHSRPIEPRTQFRRPGVPPEPEKRRREALNASDARATNAPGAPTTPTHAPRRGIPLRGHGSTGTRPRPARPANQAGAVPPFNDAQAR